MRTNSLSSCILAVALSLCTGAAAQGAGQDPSNSARDFTPPLWPSPPVPSDDYPEFAGVIGLKGAVTLNCLAKVDGRIDDCRVEEAVPGGLGFEQQALRDATTYTIIPARTSEGSVARRVAFTIRFSPDDEPSPPQPWKGPKPTPEQLALAKADILSGLSQGFELPEPDLDHIDLADLDADVREKVQVILTTWPMPKVETEHIQNIMAEGLALVLAKHGYESGFAVPLKQQDQFAEDLLLAMASLSPRLTQDEKAWISQVRNDFCAVHDCGPQD